MRNNYKKYVHNKIVKKFINFLIFISLTKKNLTYYYY